jgi:hypothetical protein
MVTRIKTSASNIFVKFKYDFTGTGTVPYGVKYSRSEMKRIIPVPTTGTGYTKQNITCDEGREQGGVL